MALPLLAFYKSLMGLTPPENHLSFYGSGARGFNTRDTDDDQVRAMLAKALWLTMRYPRVSILTPKTLEKQTLQEIQKHARFILRRFKGNTDQVKRIVAAFKKLQVVSRLLTQNDQQTQWVSISYSDTDPVPDWLKEKLWPTKT
jgi:hypothetical protein